ncbi:hypothetical protein P9112_009974 [Eukaryota sp. TZLM1-RC]
MLLNPETDIRTLKNHASEDTQVRAIYTYLWLDKTQSEVAEFFLVSQSTISRWLERKFSRKTPITTYLSQILHFFRPQDRSPVSTWENSLVLYRNSFNIFLNDWLQAQKCNFIKRKGLCPYLACPAQLAYNVKTTLRTSDPDPVNTDTAFSSLSIEPQDEQQDELMETSTTSTCLININLIPISNQFEGIK